MTTMWGIHNDQPQLDLVENGFVSIGWDEMSDLREIAHGDRDRMKAAVAETYPHFKPGAIRNFAGTLLSFADRMQVGDIVVYPHKPDSTLNFGRITSDYRYEPAHPLHKHRRSVKWLKTGEPRTTFSQDARYEVGSAITIFQIRRYAAEFQAFIDDAAVPAPVAAAEEIDLTTDAPTADRIEQDTRDFIVETIMRELEGVQFESFVAHLLKVMGYRTRVTQASGDGGVDVIAHRDPLGLEPPIIKVQCKRKTSTIGGPEVQQLTGTLASGGQELGLFVTLGAFSKDAEHIARNRQDIRLINGTELVQLIFEHYDRFDPEYKALLPMRAVYVVDRV